MLFRSGKETLWNNAIRFGALHRKGKKGVKKSYALAGDDWVRQFVSNTKMGVWKEVIDARVKEKGNEQCILLPNTVDAKKFTYPTFTEISALCYGVVSGTEEEIAKKIRSKSKEGKKGKQKKII